MASSDLEQLCSYINEKIGNVKRMLSLRNCGEWNRFPCSPQLPSAPPDRLYCSSNVHVRPGLRSVLLLSPVEVHLILMKAQPYT